MFDRKYLKNEIEKLDGALPDHVNLYLIGGGSMSFMIWHTAICYRK